MTSTTKEQARAIAEALGWKLREDTHYTYKWVSAKGDVSFRAPRLNDDTTLGRAMCYDAIEWLDRRDGDPLPWRVKSGTEKYWEVDGEKFYTLSAAVEAAVIKELNI